MAKTLRCLPFISERLPAVEQWAEGIDSDTPQTNAATEPWAQSVVPNFARRAPTLALSTRESEPRR
jgi:hypothetical protein